MNSSKDTWSLIDCVLYVVEKRKGEEMRGEERKGKESGEKDSESERDRERESERETRKNRRGEGEEKRGEDGSGLQLRQVKLPEISHFPRSGSGWDERMLSA